MAKTLQFRRGTTSEISAITGAVGELFVDTTKDTVVVMDGSTAGGFPLATEAALASGLSAKADTSALTSGLAAKQNTLVSGTNIKTINGTSVLGSGNIVISGGGGGSADLSAVAQDVVPSTSATFNIGSSANRWKDAYLSDGIIVDQVSVKANTTTTYPLETYAFTGFLNGQVYVNGNELIVYESSANNGWSAWASQNWNTAHLIGATISAVSLGGTEAPWSDTITGFTSGGPYYGFTLSSGHGFGSHIISLTIVAPSATPLITHSLVSDSELVAPTATIGDVYYENNVISPIPVITTTSYGEDIVNTPLVVNAPLTVMSGDTSSTVFLTFSSSEMSGYRSGGVNNWVQITPYNSDPTYPGSVVSMNIGVNSESQLTKYKKIRAGDVITAIGTNGIFTGQFDFKVIDVLIVPAITPYSTDINIVGRLTQPNAYQPSGAAINVMTVKRPYDQSVISGGLSVENYISTNEAKANVVNAEKTLVAPSQAILGATYHTSWGATTDYLGNKFFADIRTSDYLTAFLSTLYAPFNGFRLSTYVPPATLTLRTVNIAVTFSSGATIDLSSPTMDITYYDPQDFSYNNTTVISIKWAAGGPPTTATSGQTIMFTFLIEGTSTIYASYKAY